MAYISGQTILNPGQQGATAAHCSVPFLTVPQGKTFDVQALIFTSTLNAAITLLIFKDTLNTPPILTVVVSPLAGQPGSQFVAQNTAYVQQLVGGEQLFALPTAVTAYGFFQIEVDGFTN